MCVCCVCVCVCVFMREVLGEMMVVGLHFPVHVANINATNYV